jgi:hypothetical protein
MVIPGRVFYHESRVSIGSRTSGSAGKGHRLRDLANGLAKGGDGE